jgi:hypothetical protein
LEQLAQIELFFDFLNANFLSPMEIVIRGGRTITRRSSRKQEAY